MLPPQSAARVADVQSGRARGWERLCRSDGEGEAVNGASGPAADIFVARAEVP